MGRFSFREIRCQQPSPRFGASTIVAYFYRARERQGVCAAMAREAACVIAARRSDRIQSNRASAVLKEEKQARRFYISGRVQGVGYRFFACSAAEQAGVRGYVRNLRDGRVEVYAIGSPAQLSALREALQRGPRMAWVENVDEHSAEVLPRFSSSFRIED